MPRNQPHRLAFFSLVPLNQRTWAVLNHPENAHLVSVLQVNFGGETVYGLDVGLHIGSKSRYTLATIGRCGDIVVEGSGVSRIQCSFEFHKDNQEIMLQDRSTNKSTRCFGETAMSFEDGRTHRQVVVDDHVNLEFGFGGLACDLYKFRIAWHEHNEIANGIEEREDNPRHTRTVLDEPPTIAPSQPVTRIRTPGALNKIRFSKRNKIGDGVFGEVWRVANVDSGEHLAVKRVRRPALLPHDYIRLKREVETLSRISHRNIVEYISAQWGDEFFDIIMALKLGNVEDLIRKDLFIREPALAEPFLHQMLQALDYLASKSIIHRDVKPENILYTTIPEGYLYQLADFGLANIIGDARSFTGTKIYMAPELEYGQQWPQTPKMDVWSLVVTLTYAMNVANFRMKPLHTTPLRIQAIHDAVNEAAFQPLRAMAIVNPNNRAAAADMLDQLFDGEGRATPVHAAAPSPDEAQPGLPEQHDEVATGENGPRTPAETGEGLEAVMAPRDERPRRADGATEEQRQRLEAPACQTPPTGQKPARNDEPRLRGAILAPQSAFEHQPRFP